MYKGANKNRTIYVNSDVIEDRKDEYIKVKVPYNGVVYDIMTPNQNQTNVDFEDG